MPLQIVSEVPADFRQARSAQQGERVSDKMSDKYQVRGSRRHANSKKRIAACRPRATPDLSAGSAGNFVTRAERPGRVADVKRLCTDRAKASARGAGGTKRQEREMTGLRLGFAAAAMAALLCVASSTPEAQPTAVERCLRRRQRPRRRRAQRAGAGGRRLGDRGDHRPPHQIHQDRRHRRPGPLCAARTAEGHLQRLGTRLRPGRFAQGARRRPAGSSI